MLNTRIKTLLPELTGGGCYWQQRQRGSLMYGPPADRLQISMEIRHGSLVTCSALLCLSSDGWPQTLQGPAWQDTASVLDMHVFTDSYKWQYLHHTWCITSICTVNHCSASQSYLLISPWFISFSFNKSSKENKTNYELCLLVSTGKKWLQAKSQCHNRQCLTPSHLPH